MYTNLQFLKGTLFLVTGGAGFISVIQNQKL